MNALVYCGSRSSTEPAYATAAETLAQRLVDRKIGLVYGGGSVGLMGTIARRVTQSGGQVVGIIPTFLATDEISYVDGTELVEVESMHERKLQMIERSDLIIAMPGAYGTLDELFEAITWLQLGLHSKPIGLLNTKGYYNAIISQFDRMVEDGFLTQRNRNLLHIAEDPTQLLEHLVHSAISGYSDDLEERA